jgi:hypothetical protein
MICVQSNFSYTIASEDPKAEIFDVFLCHNSDSRPGSGKAISFGWLG